MARKWNRRLFLKTASLGMIALGTGGTPPFLGRLLAQTQEGMRSRRKTLVTIFQRGAMDGIMAVPPLGDDGLRRMRPRLSMSDRSNDDSARILRLGDGYGLHPALAPLVPLYQDGSLAIVHGVGSPNTTRSHFDAQDFMETGTPFRKGTATGWLNRAMEQMQSDGSTFRAVSLTPSLPRSLYGPEPTLAIADLEQFALRGGKRRDGSAPTAGFESLYEQTSMDLLRGRGEESFDAMHSLEELNPASYRPSDGARYPTSPLGNALKQIAFLIKAEVGLEIAFAESGGWDTHVQQGTVNGAFANRAGDLAQSIGAFWTDLADYRDDVVLTPMTEFGRTVHENGSGGTDHGRASCLFVLGTSVDGGVVHGGLPQLRPEDLEDGRDLPIAIDFREVFAEVAGTHLSIDDDDALFPGWDGQRITLLRG